MVTGSFVPGFGPIQSYGTRAAALRRRASVRAAGQAVGAGAGTVIVRPVSEDRAIASITWWSATAVAKFGCAPEPSRIVRANWAYIWPTVNGTPFGMVSGT